MDACITPSRSSRPQAFSLVEVVLALGIGAMALVAIIGLMPTSLQCTRNTVETTQAALVARMISYDLRASATSGTSASVVSSSSSALYGIPLKTGTTTFYLDKLGLAAGLTSGSAQYRAQVIINSPQGQFTASYAIAPVFHASIQLTWPAAASINNASGSLEAASSFTPSPAP